MSTETETKTKTSVMADLGINWKWVGYWTYPAYSKMASVNGQLCIVYDNGSFAPVQVYGENHGSCFICGYMPLVHHYLLKEKNTGRMVNIGSECLSKILSKPKAEHIKGAVESIKRKVTADFKRPIKNEDLKAYVKQVYDVEKARDVRKARILKAVQDNPELYWTYKFETKYDEKTGKHIETDIIRSDEVRSKDAVSSMNSDINFWANMRDHYIPIGNNQFWDSWNPDTMIRAMKKEATKDGLSLPKFRELTQEEKIKLDELIAGEITQLINRLEKKETA